jgi:SAM-dependent methyltransferase
MNRERNLAGGNSYEKDLGFAPLAFLNKRLEKQRESAWLDLCCGRGRALIQAAEVCGDRIRLTGVDLVPMFDPIGAGLDAVRLIAASLERWETADRFDLITCVHGLHYIGDKLGVMQRASGWLKEDGLLAMHLDLRNVRIMGRLSAHTQVGKDLRRAGFRYQSARHLLTRGAQTLRQALPYRYLGADDGAGPNYTGQAAVNSYYERVG